MANTNTSWANDTNWMEAMIANAAARAMAQQAAEDRTRHPRRPKLKGRVVYYRQGNELEKIREKYLCILEFDEEKL